MDPFQESLEYAAALREVELAEAAAIAQACAALLPHMRAGNMPEDCQRTRRGWQLAFPYSRFLVGHDGVLYVRTHWRWWRWNPARASAADALQALHSPLLGLRERAMSLGRRKQVVGL